MFFHTFREREELYNLFEMLVARDSPPFTPGSGVDQDLPPGFIEPAAHFRKFPRKRSKSMINSTTHRVWIDRTKASG